jgi:hypothetical protein
MDSVALARASLTGIVSVDTTGGPVANAQVTLEDLALTARTNVKGAFRFDELPAGEHRLRVRAIGYAPFDATLTLAAGQQANRRVTLGRVPALDEIVVNAERRNPRMRDFEETKRLGLGHFFTSDDIERQRPAVLAQLLSSTNGLYVIRTKGRAYVVANRGAKSLTGRPCGPDRLADVYIDDVRMYSGKAGEERVDINTIDPGSIAGIEFYASSAQAPARYQNLNSVCGVLVIWTKR